MRVAIEIDDAGGIMRGGTLYIRKLLEEFARMGGRDEFLLFGFLFRDPERLRRQFSLPQSKNFSHCVKRWPQSLVDKIEWEWRLPLIESYLARLGVDVYHAFRAPSRRCGNVVLTVPDVWPIRRPEWMTPQFKPLWEQRMRPGILRAKKIVTYCRATQKDIVEGLGVPEERVRVTPLGVDRDLFRKIDDGGALGAARLKFNLPERFFLMVGPFDVLCHFQGVVEAMGLLKKSGRPLVVVAVGPVDDKVKALQRLAQEAGLADHFTWTGYVAQEDLALLYNLAEGLVYPSLLPGVELPPYEAMACGLPVITSLEENIEDAGLLIDPRSPAEIAAAIGKVWDSAGVREDLSRRGIARAASFTWERTAKTTLDVYREAAA